MLVLKINLPLSPNPFSKMRNFFVQNTGKHMHEQKGGGGRLNFGGQKEKWTNVRGTDSKERRKEMFFFPI